MSTQNIQDKVNKYKEVLSILEGMDKIQYIVDLAKDVEPLDEKYKLDSFKIRGCASSLWVVPMYKDNTLNFMHDADSSITKGYAKIVLDILNVEVINNITFLTSLKSNDCFLNIRPHILRAGIKLLSFTLESSAKQNYI